LILIIVKYPGDIVIYAAIVSGANLLAAIIAFFVAVRFFKLRLAVSSPREIINLFAKVQPFFWSTAVNNFKQRGVELSIGLLFGMREVAIYDLANKLFTIASVFASNINAALFPVFMKGFSKATVRKIFVYEVCIGFIFILSMVLFSDHVISAFFQEEMMPAYGVSIALSFNILAYLVVGCYMYFIFIPSERYDLVIKSQIVGAGSFAAMAVAFLLLNWNFFSIISALVLSGFVEIAFCWLILNQTNKSAMRY